MERYLIVFVMLLWLGGIGAFLLYVPLLPVLAVTLILFGFVLMFVLGIQVGCQISPGPRRAGMTEVRRNLIEHTSKYSRPA
jgi:hypothetical protein